MELIGVTIMFICFFLMFNTPDKPREPNIYKDDCIIIQEGQKVEIDLESGDVIVIEDDKK